MCKHRLIYSEFSVAEKLVWELACLLLKKKWLDTLKFWLIISINIKTNRSDFGSFSKGTQNVFLSIVNVQERLPAPNPPQYNWVVPIGTMWIILYPLTHILKKSWQELKLWNTVSSGFFSFWRRMLISALLKDGPQANQPLLQMVVLTTNSASHWDFLVCYWVSLLVHKYILMQNAVKFLC